MKGRAKSILLALAAALVWAFALFYSQNIILYTRDWTPFHLSKFTASADGVEQAISRRLLAQFEVRGGFFGLRHHIVTKKTFSVTGISGKFDLGHQSIIMVGVVTPEGSTAVRFSAHELIPGLFYSADKEEKVLAGTIIPGRLPEGVVPFTIKKVAEGLSVFVNGKEIFRGPGAFPEGNVFLKVYKGAVKELEVNSTSLPFRPDIPILNLIWPLALVFGVISIFLPRFATIIFLLGVLWTSYDYTFYSLQRVRFNTRTVAFESLNLPVDAEGFRGKFFEAWFRLSGGETAKLDHIREKRVPLVSFAPFRKCDRSGCQRLIPGALKSLRGGSENKFRILMIGGSLIGGWGTTGLNGYYPAHFTRFLSEKLKKDIEVVTISGFLPEVLSFRREDFQRLVEIFRPRMVIVELRTMKADIPLMNEIRSAKVAKTEVIVLKTPNNYPAIEPERFTANGPGYTADPEDRKVLSGFEAGFIDSNPLFCRPENYREKNLFLDDVHLNNAGSAELGNFLGEELLERVKKAAGE